VIESWEEVTLDDVSEDITVGHVGAMADQYVEVGVPFLRSLNVEPFRINTSDLKKISKQFHQRLKKSALKPGDIIIVRTGNPGSCAVIPDWLTEANCSDVVVVRAGPKVRPGYVSYVVNSTAVHHIDAHTVGAVQQHFNVGSARRIRFRLPPIEEQDRILSVLGALNDKIELNRRMNETLEAMARAIFKDWFVDFVRLEPR
jgi:type I restriction enzyme S subunit